MKYCSKCGAEIHDEAVICPKCGCAVQGMNAQIVPGKRNTMAIVGFILSFFVNIAGLILGILGLNQSKKMNGDGKGLSIAAIVISAVSIVAITLYILLAVILVAAYI